MIRLLEMAPLASNLPVRPSALVVKRVPLNLLLAMLPVSWSTVTTSSAGRRAITVDISTSRLLLRRLLLNTTVSRTCSLKSFLNVVKLDCTNNLLSRMPKRSYPQWMGYPSCQLYCCSWREPSGASYWWRNSRVWCFEGW